VSFALGARAIGGRHRPAASRRRACSTWDNAVRRECCLAVKLNRSRRRLCTAKRLCLVAAIRVLAETAAKHEQELGRLDGSPATVIMVRAWCSVRRGPFARPRSHTNPVLVPAPSTESLAVLKMLTELVDVAGDGVTQGG
jgi:hypothetical protein